jgi:alkylation response protein AidB-like acyl-CoA dehydrogenase
MSEYRPPVDDMLFVLDRLVPTADLLALPPFAHLDRDTLAGVLEEAGRLFSETIAPLNQPGDRQGSRLQPDGVVTPDGFADAYHQFVKAGWGGAHLPVDWGGGGLPYVMGMALQEMLSSANMAFSLCPMLTQAAVESLLNFGSEEQKATYLEKLVTGVWAGTMNLSEPQAGSDLGAIRTRAVRQPDGTYRIFGNKIFITWGDHDMAENIVHLVLARTDDAAPGTKGISMFLVPKYVPGAGGGIGHRNDVTVVSIEHKLGIHASPTCVLSFGDNDGAVGYILGEEQQGMRYMFAMMNTARLGVAVEGVALTERSYQQALRFATERRQGRAPGSSEATSRIIEHPDVRRMLLTMKSHIDAMRGLLYRAAYHVDMSRHHPDEAERQRHQERVALLTPIAKAWCTDLGVEMTSVAIQIHGGMGFVEETGVAQHYRDARIAPIYEGTNGIQAVDLVTRKLPLRGGETVAEALKEVEQASARLASLDPGLAENMRAALGAVRRSVSYMLEALPERPRDALAGAGPFLRQIAMLLAAGAMADEVLAAEDSPERATIARFFLSQVLPQSAALEPAVTAGDAALVII